MLFGYAPPPPSTKYSWPPLTSTLYLSHTALEVVLGAIKLRGRYQHEAAGSRSPRSEMYTRHHGSSILALALLSYLVYTHDCIDSDIGRSASCVLAVFHWGAVLSFLHLGSRLWFLEKHRSNVRLWLVRLSVRPFIRPFVRPSVRPFVRPSIHPPAQVRKPAHLGRHARGLRSGR